jgi:hypothetical protein
MCVSSVAAGPCPVIPPGSPASQIAQGPRVFTVRQALEEGVGLPLGHLAVVDRAVEDRPGVPETDLKHRVVEFARVGGAA